MIKVITECTFDIKISDSQFELENEFTGACDPEKVPPPTAEADLADDPELISSKSRASQGKLISDNAPSKPEQNGTYVNVTNPGGGQGAGTELETTIDDEVYRGLPPPGSLKRYRADYPTDLHLRKVCDPKPHGKRKTVDNYRTQPLAKFSPVSSADAILHQESKATDPTTKTKGTVVSDKPCRQRARDLPPIVSVSDEDVIDYLEDNNIQMMFEYFLSMCILDTPEDPYKYIADIANQLIQARTDEVTFEKLPRVLNLDQLNSMFRLYDRVGSGYMRYHQYKNAFDSMSIIRYNQEPQGYLTDEIPKQTFITEAKNAINELLRSFMFKTSRSSNDC